MPDRIFYDGTCGLCQRAVGFVLARDRGRWFRFAPLQGETFRNEVPDAERAALPDSLILKTADGRLLLRSEAGIHVLRRLGGGWPQVAVLVRVIPRPMRDWIYDWIAANRRRLFRRLPDLCPVLPEHLRAQFDP